MKLICTTIACIFLVAFIALATTIGGNTTHSNIDGLIDLPAFVYIVIFGILAFLSGFMYSQSKIEQVKSEATKQVRKAEKAGIDSKESLDKINRLNSKIETLEIALQEALKAKNNN